MDYENETDLLYAVVTLPDSTSDDNMQSNLYFINERNGSVLKTVPLPTWEPVSHYRLTSLLPRLPLLPVCFMRSLWRGPGGRERERGVKGCERRCVEGARGGGV